MNLRQAAQQALEALIPLANAASPNERECLTDEDHERAAEAVEALCAALAEPENQSDFGADSKVNSSEPEQEPDGISWLKRDSGYFTAPTPRKPLTDAEIHDLWLSPPGEVRNARFRHTKFARAIERAHGIGEQT